MTLRLLVAHPWQVKDLEQDPNFQNAIQGAMIQSMAKDNPFLIGAKYIWGGFAIYENEYVSWPVNVENTVPYFGPFLPSYNGGKPKSLLDFDNYATYGQVAQNTKFAAVVLGDNAVAKASAGGLEFIQETFDYKTIIGIGYSQLHAAARADYWNVDDGIKGQYLNNESSALVVTHAEAPSF
jgi:hypothetical protein